MHIRNLQQSVTKHSVTFSAAVRFQGATETRVYFTVPAKYASFLRYDASSLLAGVLLPCMKTGEDIIIEGAVSAKLLKNTYKIMNLVASWNIGLKPITIQVTEKTRDDFRPRRRASFFSGGVDSFYTYLSRKKTKQKITHFLFIHGFDISLANTSLYKKTLKNITAVAKSEQVEVITIETNLSKLIEPVLVWEYSHGGALAAVALLFRKGFQDIYISSAVKYNQLFPYGTHPLLDKFWSTESLSISHIGTEYSRLEKVSTTIAFSPLALQFLRVCTQNRANNYNCSRCFKCLVSMLELTCAGVLEKTKTFQEPLKPKLVSQLYFDYSQKYNLLGEEILAGLGKQKTYQELQAALASSLQNSKKFSLRRTLAAMIAYWDQQYNKRRLYQFIFMKNISVTQTVLFSTLRGMGGIK